MAKPSKSKSKKTKTAPVKLSKTPQQRLEIQIPDMKNWLENPASFAHKNPGALLVGGMAVVLAFLLLLP